MSRYIDADKLIGELHSQFLYDGRDRARVYAKIQEQTTADVRENVKGKWVLKWNTFFKKELPTCSACNNVMPYVSLYCPNCGADMRGGTNECE